MDVTTHEKQEDWQCLEENISCAKKLLETLELYQPPQRVEAASASLQLLAVSDVADGNDSAQ
jgi:hypothetical protein